MGQLMAMLCVGLEIVMLLLEVTKEEKKTKVPPRFELGLQDSESWVLTITPWDHACLFSKSPSLSLKIELKTVIISVAVVAEWLRRLTRNQLRSPCTGSNPVNCAIFFIRFFCLTSLGKS